MKQREIYTVPWPFTNLSASQERPALVISNDKVNTNSQDYIMLPLTSNVDTPNPYTVRIAPADLEPGGRLPKLSEIKVNIAFTANRSLIKGYVGILRQPVFDQVKKEFLKVL